MDQVIELNAPQSRAWQKLEPGNTVAIPWGRGVGKSYFVRLVCYLLVARWDGRYRPAGVNKKTGRLSKPRTPGVRIAILMPTLEQFRKVHLSLLLAELESSGPDGWKHLGGVINKTTLRVEFPGGSWIQVVSAEAIQGNRGIRCDVTIIDEADDVDPEAIDAVTLAWFTEPHSLETMMIGGTPKRGRFGLLWKAHNDWPNDPKKSATHFSFHATCYDAPDHVSEEYLEKVKEKIRPEVFAREYLCNFDSAEGLVYSMFEPDFHVRSPRKGQQWSEILVGVDHGSVDPAVFLVIGVQGHGNDAVCWVIEEFYQPGKVPSELEAKATDIRYRYRHWKQTWYADPSRTEMIEMYSRAHVPIEKASNAIEEGVAAVADRLTIRERDGKNGEPAYRTTRLFIDPSCKNTIRELGLYRRKRDPRNPEVVIEAILDKNNHALDALRYCIFSRFGGPLRQKLEQRYGHSAFAR